MASLSDTTVALRPDAPAARAGRSRAGVRDAHGGRQGARREPAARRLAGLCLAWRDGCLDDAGGGGMRRRLAGLYGGAAAPAASSGWEPAALRRRLERPATDDFPSHGPAWLDLAAVAPKMMSLSWRVTEAGRRALYTRIGVRPSHGGAPLAFLRFFDVTEGRPAAGADHFDISVDYAAGLGHHNQEVWTAGRAYVAELWLRPAEGMPSGPVARSNPCRLPRDAAGPASDAPDHFDARWLAPAARPALAEVDAPAELARLADADPARDLEAEALVRALYRGLLAIGPRVLRNAPEVPYTSPEQRRQAQARRRRMRDAYPRARRGTGVDGAGSLCWIARLERPGRPAAAETVTVAAPPAYPLATLDYAPAAVAIARHRKNLKNLAAERSVVRPPARKSARLPAAPRPLRISGAGARVAGKRVRQAAAPAGKTEAPGSGERKAGRMS